MAERALVVVHRALTALHLGDSAQLARHLHADVIYDRDNELVKGRDAVVEALTASPYQHLETRIFPGRVEQTDTHFIAHTTTILRWRASSEDADISTQLLAIHMQDDLIARIELMPTTGIA